MLIGPTPAMGSGGRCGATSFFSRARVPRDAGRAAMGCPLDNEFLTSNLTQSNTLIR